MALPQEKRKYTFADHLQWDESERVELIDGEPFMQADPSRRHQFISGEIFSNCVLFWKARNAGYIMRRLQIE